MSGLSRVTTWMVACFLAGITLAACGGGGGGGGGGDSDAGTTVTLPVAQTGDSPMGPFANADLSCVGMRTAPTAGDEISLTFNLKDFQTSNIVDSATVQFFTDNVIADTCAPPNCQTGTADDMGRITFMGRARQWYAYRVLPHMGDIPSRTVVGSVQYNETAPATTGGSVEGNSVSQATINLIPTVLGFRRAAGTAIVAGRFDDCDGDNVRGVIVRVFGSDGMEIAEGAAMSEPHIRYFNGMSFPSATAPHTDVDGLFAVANIPIERSPVRIEAWGKTSDTGALTKLGCEEARVFGDTVTIMNVEPLRADGPAACR